MLGTFGVSVFSVLKSSPDFLSFDFLLNDDSIFNLDLLMLELGLWWGLFIMTSGTTVEHITVAILLANPRAGLSLLTGKLKYDRY